MNRFSFLFFLFLLSISSLSGVVSQTKDTDYFTGDILCDYKIPVACGIYRTLLCKGRYKDLSSISVLKNCGCDADGIDARYGEKIYLNPDCRINSYNMSGYEKLILGMKIDLNTADKRDLMSIDGIGETMAERILEYRIKNGKFNRIDELRKIKGIGRNSLEKIAKYVCVVCGAE
ncbi:MAG: helix-hairpin-helix domain-containing protein [Deltaproteobacteria bacterium]|nr:helix-hairpin-helix domain-containing protein [Deltaproteobacteria bacterium]